MQTPTNTVTHRRLTLGEYLDLADYASEIQQKDDRIASLEESHAVALFWFRRTLSEWHDEIQRHNETRAKLTDARAEIRRLRSDDRRAA